MWLIAASWNAAAKLARVASDSGSSAYTRRFTAALSPAKLKSQWVRWLGFARIGIGSGGSILLASPAQMGGVTAWAGVWPQSEQKACTPLLASASSAAPGADGTPSTIHGSSRSLATLSNASPTASSSVLPSRT